LLRYIVKRIAYAILTLFVLITLTFFMMRLVPGEPFTGDKAIKPAVMENMMAKYGLDKPTGEQYLIFMGNCLRGDLGISIVHNRPVSELIGLAFPASARLGISAIIFALLFGVLLGAVAAVKRGTLLDSGTMLIAMLGVSVPSFILGALFQYFLALQLNRAVGTMVFPIQGWGTVRHMFLPAFALGLGSLATVSRLMRTSMLDVLGQDYIKTAKAKGLSQGKVLWRHALAQRHHAGGDRDGADYCVGTHGQLRGGEYFQRAGAGQILCFEYSGFGLYDGVRHDRVLRCAADILCADC